MQDSDMSCKVSSCTSKDLSKLQNMVKYPAICPTDLSCNYRTWSQLIIIACPIIIFDDVNSWPEAEKGCRGVVQLGGLVLVPW